MPHALLRRAATLLLAVTVSLTLAASAARADVPPLVVKNMRAITELEYKYFDPGHGDTSYPTCHRTCEQLFSGLGSFDELDELYLLAARSGLTSNLNNEPFPLGSSSVDTEVVHGYVTSYNGPVRYSGLQIPGINAFAAFSLPSASVFSTML